MLLPGMPTWHPIESIIASARLVADLPFLKIYATINGGNLAFSKHCTTLPVCMTFVFSSESSHLVLRFISLVVLVGANS